MPIEDSKAHEIKRLSTPIDFKNSKAYDEEGNILNCVETIYDVRYIVEPMEGILSDDEILKYAPKSKSASKVRLKKGVGTYHDVLLIHESLPQISALYYVILICTSVPVIYSGNQFIMLVLLVLFIIPLIYMYQIFNLNRYKFKKVKKQKTKLDNNDNVSESTTTSFESLKVYEKEINDLKVLFDVKEQVVRDLIKKRFEPPQITYDKFISAVDKTHELFYLHSEQGLNLINLVVEDTPRVHSEIKNKIEVLNTLIQQIENLTNELVININDDDGATEEVKSLLNDMENLIDSVKDY